MELLSAVFRWSLRNRAMVMLAAALFTVLGIQAALGLPVDAVPDITTMQVQVITSAPALSPVEVERMVSVPVERAMAGTPKATEIRSLSKYGLSIVTVVFEEDTDLYFARQQISERLKGIEEAVPARYGRPELAPATTGLGEVFQFVLRGEGHSLMELEELLDWYLAPQLRMVPGVVDVNTLGGENKEYQVVVDPARLQASGLSVQEVLLALERTNANAGGGYLEHNREQLVIGTQGLVSSLDDLKSAVLGATPLGVPITVASIGEVRFGPQLRRGAASMDGKGEVVVGTALMLTGENARAVTRRIAAKLEELKPSLPQGVVVEPFYDRSILVDRTLHTVAKNLAEGALLVVMVLLLLLGDVRAGLIVASTIPLSMLFALILMRATGASGNLMSLGAIDFGLIVDSSVIIVENAVRRLGQARRSRRSKASLLSLEERSATVQGAAMEVLSASIYGQAIIAIVYLPILALRGTEGKLFHPMANSVLFALTGSFIFSLTVVPVLCALFLKPQDTEAQHEPWLMRGLHALFLPLFGAAFRHRGRTLTGGLLLLALGLALSTRLGAEFVPQLDEGDILLEVRRLPGISLTEAIEQDRRVELALLEVPEVLHTVAKTGSPELGTDPMGIDQTDVFITLKPRADWREGLTKEELGTELAGKLQEKVPEAAIAVSQPIQMRTNELVAGVKSDVAAQIYGPDLEVLQTLADQMAGVLRKVPGAVAIRAEQGTGLSYLRILPDRARLARYGLTVDDVNTLTETLSVGGHAGVVIEGDRRFALVVKLGAELGGNLEAIRSLPLKSRTSQMVPLGDVAELQQDKGPAVVNRDKQSRRRAVELNVRGRDLVSVVEEAQSLIAHEVQLPAGYRVEWGGQFENFLSAKKRLMWVVPLALALILSLLWAAFQEAKPALLIFLNIPFAVVGGVAALFLRGIPFSISAGVGFVALLGVAVLNGLVLVSFARQLQAGGRSPSDAIKEATELRLRPVLMTALVAALGFLPMALSTDPGSEVQRPLATVVIGGLLSATALTLFFFPTLYAWVHRRSPATGASGGLVRGDGLT